MANKHVYLFREGDKDWRDLLGGKGANLAEMSKIGLPVPNGFTITTETCNEYYSNGQEVPAGLWDEVATALKEVEETAGKKFGDASNPLLVSVRSGAKFSMPGMMDTVLNLGLNEETLQGIINLTGNERFVYDSYRRFLMMFSDIVLSGEYAKLKKHEFEIIFDEVKEKLGVKLDSEVGADDLKGLCVSYKEYFKGITGFDFPSDPMEQLKYAVMAVFKSWMNERAIIYRRREKISDSLGTAVNIQMMVFGNMGDDSGTGVAFTRDAATGDNRIFGEYLMNAQGEDVVAGVRTPQPVSQLEEQNPEIYKQFIDIATKLENHYKDMQDIEFTIEKGKLYILQCRSGKRTGAAAVKIAVDQVNEGLITKEQAVARVAPEQLEQLLHPRLVNSKKLAPIAKGLNAGPGGAVGAIAFNNEMAVLFKEQGKDVILVRKETNPDDLAGMLASKGVLTQLGGRTSHAALVARQYGIPTICGCPDVKFVGDKVQIGAKTFSAGDIISIDGTMGEVFEEALQTEPVKVSGDFGTFMGWADDIRKAKNYGVRANADTPAQALQSIELGAEGIGLCRTEHMFLGEERADMVRDMILAQNDADRNIALDKLEALQKEDFVAIFKAMGGLPVTIRLIDPPLHEFLPALETLLVETTEMRVKGDTGKEYNEKMTMLGHVRDLHEYNPMLGLRGVRLSVYIPGIVKMQVAAIIAAACEVKKSGLDVHPEIMIPLVGILNELTYVKEQLEDVAKGIIAAANVDVDYKFGTMIEIPRAALTAGEIAKHAEFFSFGTNDLTQMTYGLSRDDAAKFLPVYLDKKIIDVDPTESIDTVGVGRLMQLCAKEAKEVRPNIKLGICGEHGGDPDSIKFCFSIGLNYVSCSPKRIPVARLAAAQAAIDGAASRDK